MEDGPRQTAGVPDLADSQRGGVARERSSASYGSPGRRGASFPRKRRGAQAKLSQMDTPQTGFIHIEHDQHGEL